MMSEFLLPLQISRPLKHPVILTRVGLLTAVLLKICSVTRRHQFSYRGSVLV